MIYQPGEDSYLLQKEVKKRTKNKSFLDMGSGSGIQAETAIKAEAKSVLASDVNPEVINHLKKLQIPATQSDLFNNIEGKFDVVAFNPPYLPEDKNEDTESCITTTGGEKGDEITLKFLKQAPKHLNKDGVILLVLSNLTPNHRIETLIKKLKLKKRILSKKKLFMETLECWGINHNNA
jgi:release factor glutamine methyltransferase